MHPVPYRCCLLPSRFEYIDRRTCPSMSSAGPFSPSRLLLHLWGSGPPCKTWFHGPAQVRITHGFSICSAVVAGLLAVVTDRPTDRPRYSVCSSKPHLAIAAMPPKKRQREARGTTHDDICTRTYGISVHYSTTASTVNIKFT